MGDERGCFTYRSGNDSRNAYATTLQSEAVALVFAQYRDRSSGTFYLFVCSFCQCTIQLIVDTIATVHAFFSFR